VDAVDAVMAEAERWRAERAGRGEPPLAVNAGLAVGRIVFGAVGDAPRLQYTVIRDPVKLAPKLQEPNKGDSTRALATAETLERALTQGCRSAGHLERRPQRPVGGLPEPIDLVALT